jgi:hypothetical protein
MDASGRVFACGAQEGGADQRACAPAETCTTYADHPCGAGKLGMSDLAHRFLPAQVNAVDPEHQHR